MLADIDSIDAHATTLALDDALTLPGRVYCDPQVFALELDNIFLQLWVGVGHQSQLAQHGDFIRVDFGTESIVLVVDEKGVTSAFHNVCRHRGTRLVADMSGHGLTRIQCPYHAWSYATNGALTHAPRMADREDFRKEKFPLNAVRVESMNGQLFVNLNPSATTLAESLSDFPDISAWGLDGLVRQGQRQYVVAANWKLIVENYSECYHCPSVHPQLHRLSDQAPGGETSFEGRYYNGGPMILRDSATTMTLSGDSPRAALPGITGADKRHVHYYHLYPNTLVGLHPDYVLVHHVWPVAVDQTRIQTEWFFHPLAIQNETFDASDAIDFWHITNQQDWELCETAQLGVRSSGHRPGPYQPAEECVHMFDRWYAKWMGFAKS